jgi:hypothetical protein
MSLYEDQVLAGQKFEDWLNNTKETVCGLWSSAGFGKSYTAKHLIDEVILKNSNYEPVVTSMTHSAVAVLAAFTGRTVTTLHSLMGWIPHINKDTGEESISTPRMRDKNAEDRLKSDTLLIIDEGGLLGHDELDLLLAECRRTGARVLIIGDQKQCFPVVREGQELCIPAHLTEQTYLELTIPKRTSDDDMIYKLALKYRETIDGAAQPKLKTILNSDGKTGVRYVDDLEEMAYLAFKAGVRDGNTRNIKVLAFTNQRCLNLNRKIRKNVMGLKDTTPVVGEEMVANTAIQNSVGDTTIIRNNQIVIVKEVEKTESYGLPGAFIQFEREDEEGNMVDVEEVVFVPSSPDKLRTRLQKLARDAKILQKAGREEDASKRWRAFYSLKEGVSDIRFTYAMTVNKAQGITLKHALVDLDDMNICQSREQKTRLAYTAITRATDYVTIEGILDD